MCFVLQDPKESRLLARRERAGIHLSKIWLGQEAAARVVSQSLRSVDREIQLLCLQNHTQSFLDSTHTPRAPYADHPDPQEELCFGRAWALYAFQHLTNLIEWAQRHVVGFGVSQWFWRN